VAAFVFAQVPHSYCPSAVTANELALVGVYHYIVDSAAVIVIPLYAAAACVPDLDGPVFGRCDHPLALTMEGNARDIAGMALEGQHGGWVRGLDVIKFDRVVPGGSKITLVR
jgi:hypothetical protein